MPSAEFTMWQAFSAYEPWGFEVENWRMGVIASTVVNCTPRGRSAKAVKATDFYSDPYSTRKTQLTDKDRELLITRSKSGKRRHRNG